MLSTGNFGKEEETEPMIDFVILKIIMIGI
jgi:hypothetical protein